MNKKLLLLFLCTSQMVSAQNPIIRDQFTADPTARVFNGKVYVYPSHDIPAPEGQRQDWFCMADYHVFSSENLTEWEDHGVIVTHNDVAWVRPESYAMWAPDCVEKNGKYYFYFPAAPKGGRGFSVGVGISDHPEGPFVFEKENIKGVMGIDPCVLMDDDGQSYIYWSGMGIRGGKLKANMTELDGESKQMEGLPEGFKEGPFAFKREGIYYLTFPWVRKEGGTETLAYATSSTPLGPWDFKGIIMPESPTGCWTNHHSILEYKGEWYLFYHHNDYSPKFDKLRAARIDRLHFGKKGEILEVVPTLRGVGINPSTSKIDVDRYSSASKDVSISYVDTTNTFKGWYATLPEKKDWIVYKDVDFTGVRSDSYMIAEVKAEKNTELIIREKNAKGKIIGRAKVVCMTEGQFRRDNRGRWMMVTAALEHVPQGNSDLYISSEEGGLSIDWVQFKNRDAYFRPSDTSSLRPDDNGFIRRWLLLDPIDKPNRSNTVFTDSYLKEQFQKEYFAGQFTDVPKPGKQEKVEKQTLTWHGLDSERFNVKLFRFADLNQKQTYGVMFWCVTVIDCEEDIPNVRLAAGSNGASCWWLNGEEVLLLSGDRRMVEDDGMSSRLTLKKGRNILRCSVINGPGMSDFCVRFIDESGNPVRNYTINIDK